MKTCSVCKTSKSLDQFRKAKGYKDGIYSQCKTCENNRLQEWRKSNPAKVREQSRRANTKRRMNSDGYYDPNRKEEWSRARRSAHLKRKYGITLEEWETLFVAQGSKCATCHRPEGVLPNNEGHVRMVTDHCHRTNLLRGIICNDCNRALGAVRDDLVVLANLIAYLNGVVVTDR